MSLQVCGRSGQTEWMLNLSLKLGDVYQPSAMPGPSSAVAHTVEPNNNNPIMAYSAGYPNQYNPVGGSPYPQYPPQYPPLGGSGGSGFGGGLGHSGFGGGLGDSGLAGSGYGGTPCGGSGFAATPCGGGGLGH